MIVIAAGETKDSRAGGLAGFQELGYTLSGNLEDRGYVAAGKACLLQVAGDLSRAGRGGACSAIGRRDSFPRRPGLLVQAVAYLWGDDYLRTARVHAGQSLDVVADHRLGLGEAAGLGDADAGDVQLPLMLPATSPDLVGCHRSAPAE